MNTDDFTSLLSRHAGLIHKVARAYCHHDADREDLVSEIALQLWRSKDRYNSEFRETTWIYRIAINVAISFQRRHRRHSRGRSSIEISSILVTKEPEDTSSDLTLLMRCISQLHDLEKALVLLYLDGQDHSSIAEVLGISVSNVGTKLQRIKAKLKLLFEALISTQQRET